MLLVVFEVIDEQSQLDRLASLNRPSWPDEAVSQGLVPLLVALVSAHSTGPTLISKNSRLSDGIMASRLRNLPPCP